MSLGDKNNSSNLNAIEKNKVVSIVLPQDGAFNGKVYNGSGKFVLNTFIAQLSPYCAQVISVDAFENTKSVDYIVTPTITHWEQRAASWSGKPTRVKIHVSIYSVAAGKTIINNNLTIEGRRMTFVDQSAESLAAFLIKEFITEITR
jgi:hypothetical protein